MKSPVRARPRPAAVLFDMDGLLIDSERIAQQATHVTAAELGHAIPQSLSLRMIGLSADALGHLMRAEMGSTFVFEHYQERWHVHYHRALADGVPTKHGAVDALLALSAAGLPCAVATSTDTQLARQKLEKAGLLEHFAAVVGRDAVARGKPAPDLYLHAAAVLGVEPARCWAFEDSLPGLRAAVASGARTHWVPDLAPVPRDELPAGVETIESLRQICEWLG